MKRVRFNDTTIQRFRRLKSLDGITVATGPKGQPIVEVVMKITPGDVFDLCDEQADRECNKILFTNPDGTHITRFVPAEASASHGSSRRGSKLNSGE